MSSSMNYASLIAAFTPSNQSLAPITYDASIFFTEEEFLGEAQPDRETSKQFASNDGNTVQYIDNYATTGKRDITLIDGPAADALMHWAYLRPRPMFSLSARFQRNDQDEAQIREYFHKDCKITNHPARVMSNDIVVIKFTIQYGNIQLLDEDGNPV